MPVPKRKTSKRRRDKRFANKGIKAKIFTGCANCSQPLSSHTACSNCGMYKGKKILATKDERTVKRNEVKQAQAEKRQARETKFGSQEQEKK